MFTVSSAGQLAKAPGSPHPGISQGPNALAFAPGGKLLAVATGGHNTVVYNVLSSGALRTAAVLRTVAVLQTPTGIGVIGAYGVDWNRSGALLAVANYGKGNVSLYSVTR